MKYLQRYAFDTFGHAVPDKSGSFVLFSDYLKQRQSLTKSNEHLRGIVNHIGELTRKSKGETLPMSVERIVKDNTALIAAQKTEGAS